LYYYKQAFLLRTNDSRFIVALGDVYVKLEKWDEAKRCYIKAYSVNDYEGSSLCKLAKLDILLFEIFHFIIQCC
jgi:Flp pilus assembly protein TadD